MTIPDDPTAVPTSELRKVSMVALAALAPGDDRLERVLVSALERAGTLDRVIGVLARVLRVMAGSGLSLDLRKEIPLPLDREAAWKLLLYWEQRGARQAFRERKLDSLAASVVLQEPKNERGLIVTRGRIPEREWKLLVGMLSLRVLTSDSRLARLIVIKVHSKTIARIWGTCLREPGDTPG